MGSRLFDRRLATEDRAAHPLSDNLEKLGVLIGEGSVRKPSDMEYAKHLILGQ